MKISEIKIQPVRPTDKGLVAFGSFVLNDAFYCGNIGIYTALKSNLPYRLTFPTKRLANGLQLPSYHPINNEITDLITTKLYGEYDRIIGNAK